MSWPKFACLSHFIVFFAWFYRIEQFLAFLEIWIQGCHYFCCFKTPDFAWPTKELKTTLKQQKFDLMMSYPLEIECVAVRLNRAIWGSRGKFACGSYFIVFYVISARFYRFKHSKYFFEICLKVWGLHAILMGDPNFKYALLLFVILLFLLGYLS